MKRNLAKVYEEMPAAVERLENGHILKYVISDPWTMDDIIRITREGKQIYDSSSHAVHLLVDISRTTKAPRGFLSISRMPDLKHANSGCIAMVGAAGVLRAMAELVMHFFPDERMSYFDSEAEALDFLHGLIGKVVG